MTTITATKARQSLYALVKKSVKGHMPVKITSKSGDVVMISKDDYESLIETLELLSVSGLRKGIAEAKSDVKAGRTKSLKEVFGR